MLPALVDPPTVSSNDDVSSNDGKDDTEPSDAPADPDEMAEVDPVDPDGLDLDELIDASSHTDQVVGLLNEAFPGAEIDTPAEPRADQ